MDPTELTRYIHRHIPLSRTMEVAVLAVDEQAVVLHAPLDPNINHRQTVFGGSASALAILASWALLHARLTAAAIDARVVIQRNEMDYLQPITGDFTARAQLTQPQLWPRFLATLQRRGKARVEVSAEVRHDGRVVGLFKGQFVALGNAPRS